MKNAELKLYGWGLPVDGLYEDLATLHHLPKIALLEIEANPEKRDEILAALYAELRRIGTNAELHLRGSVERVQHRNNAMVKAVDAAERRIERALGSISTASLAEAFDPRGFFVYCLWGESDQVPLYVGQSGNILNRLGSHLGEARKRHKVTRITLLRCKNRGAMDRTEQSLIRRYQPPWNTTGITKPAADLEVAP